MTELRKAALKSVREMGMLRYFPSDMETREQIMLLLCRMCDTPQKIAWLTREMIDRVGEWQGPKELRGIFCSRFKPNDGIETDSSHALYSPEAGERRSIEAHVEIKRLETKPQALLNAPDQLTPPAEIIAQNDQLRALALDIAQNTPDQNRLYIAAATRDIVEQKPTLTEKEKKRRIREVEEALEPK